MAETRLGWFDCNGKNQMRWRYNTDLAPNCQNPRGNQLSGGIADEISKLCANSGVINPSGGRRLGVLKLSFKVPLKRGEKRSIRTQSCICNEFAYMKNQSSFPPCASRDMF